MRHHDDDSFLRCLLVEEGLWAKKSSEGSNGLFRAVSVGLYFTERYQEVIRNLVLSFFSHVYSAKLKTDNQIKAIERYYQNMNLVGFEQFNLEIVGRLFDVNPVLYYLDGTQLKHQNFGPSDRPSLRLLRLNQMIYSALFLRGRKDDYTFAQNLVLNMVESAINGSRAEFRQLNQDKLINFDYQRWLSQSKVQPINGNESTVACLDGGRTLGAKRGDSRPSQALINDRLVRTPGSSCNIGSEIISLFRKRKNSIRSKHQLPEEKSNPFIENNFADKKFFLMSAHQDHAPRRSQSLKSGKRGLITTTPDPHELAGEWQEGDSAYEPQQSSYNQWASVDLGSESDNSRQLAADADEKKDKSDGLGDILGFGMVKDFIDVTGSSDGPALESRLEAKAKETEDAANAPGDPPVAATSVDKPKQAKVSLKEKIKQKQILSSNKLEFTKAFSLQDPFALPNGIRSFNPVDRVFFPPAFDPRLESSHKLLSELKGSAFGKEKYSEVVDTQFYTGILKFFDEKNGFGFFQIVKDNEYDDVFVYKSEFDKADIKTEALKALKSVYLQTFRFQIATYIVQGEKRKKAINIKLA